MHSEDKNYLIKNYSELLKRYGDAPEAVQWSKEGQEFRFEKLIQIADLNNCSVLDVGCGLGHFCDFLKKRFDDVDYTGVDIVPEMITVAAAKHPTVAFICRDILAEGIDGLYDYALMNGVFNNALAKGDATEFLKEVVMKVFNNTKCGMGFNFISKYSNYKDTEMAYHDPVIVFDFCIKNLSKKVQMHHHYERCEVSVFVYR